MKRALLNSARLNAKRLLFPGPDLSIRARMKLVGHFRSGDMATLDAGCGNGAFSLAAYGLGNRVLGVNMNAGQVRKCEEYAQHVGADPARLSFRVANIYDLHSRDGRFDQIICFETLEHLMKDCDAVGLAELLSPGGLLHLCTPNRDCPLSWYRISTQEDGGHVRPGYTHEELEAMARAAGLEPIARDAYGGRAVRFAVRLERWIDEHVPLLRRLREQTRAGLLFGMTLPLIAMPDRLDGAPPLSVYVCARKPDVTNPV